jgi:hypothetical protein
MINHSANSFHFNMHRFTHMFIIFNQIIFVRVGYQTNVWTNMVLFENINVYINAYVSIQFRCTLLIKGPLCSSNAFFFMSQKHFIFGVILWSYFQNVINCPIEPRHDKTNIMGLRPAWIPTSLRIRAVWSGSMLFAYQPYYK